LKVFNYSDRNPNQIPSFEFENSSPHPPPPLLSSPNQFFSYLEAFVCTNQAQYMQNSINCIKKKIRKVKWKDIKLKNIKQGMIRQI